MALAICTPTCPRPPGHARAGAHLVVLEGRVGGDAGAQERGAGCKIQLGRNVQREVGAHCETPRVAAGRRVTLGVGTIGPQGARRRSAPLLVTGLAHLASAARANQAAHAHAVPHLEGRDAGANLGDCADELMARHKRVSHGTPLAAGTVNVRVANARVGDIEVDLALAGLTDVDLHGVELGGGIVATVGDHAGHQNSFVQSIRDETSILQQKAPTPKRRGIGVADGTRTRDVLDHNQVLYQLNYSHHRVAVKVTGRV